MATKNPAKGITNSDGTGRMFLRSQGRSRFLSLCFQFLYMPIGCDDEKLTITERLYYGLLGLMYPNNKPKDKYSSEKQ